MKKINLKGVNKEAVTGILILLLALVNATLQMFGINVIPIENEEPEIITLMDKIGVNHATTATCFCDVHDDEARRIHQES